MKVCERTIAIMLLFGLYTHPYSRVSLLMWSNYIHNNKLALFHNPCLWTVFPELCLSLFIFFPYFVFILVNNLF